MIAWSLLLLLAVTRAGCQHSLEANTAAPNKTEADVGFPEEDKNEMERSETRVPLFIPGRCPDNQLLYPGDQETDWVCDCAMRFVYYPPADGCYEVYRQGPCAVGHYLILRKGQFNPECAVNPCAKDGFVWYNGECFKLNEPGRPCEKTAKLGGIFGVNATTLELGCLSGHAQLSLIQIPSNCPPGSQRDRTSQCRKTY